jgi:hypothetical protein
MKPTRDEILNATNEQLNGWVAEYVMGTPARVVAREYSGKNLLRTRYEIYYGGQFVDLPNYAEDIAAAWEVVEKWRKERAQILDFDLRWENGHYACCFQADTGHDIVNFVADAQTAPRAISIASLLAVLDL